MANRPVYETKILPHIERIKLWVAKGATVTEVAEKLHVNKATLYRLMKTKKELSDALLAPRGDIDDEVEAALYKRSVGYDYEEVTMWQTIGRNGEPMWLERRTRKHLPPDPSSIQFWLTNRRPKEWKRMPEVKETEQDDSKGVIMMPEDTDG